MVAKSTERDSIAGNRTSFDSTLSDTASDVCSSDLAYASSADSPSSLNEDSDSDIIVTCSSSTSSTMRGHMGSASDQSSFIVNICPPSPTLCPSILIQDSSPPRCAIKSSLSKVSSGQSPPSNTSPSPPRPGKKRVAFVAELESSKVDHGTKSSSKSSKMSNSTDDDDDLWAKRFGASRSLESLRNPQSGLFTLNLSQEELMRLQQGGETCDLSGSRGVSTMFRLCA